MQLVVQLRPQYRPVAVTARSRKYELCVNFLSWRPSGCGNLGERVSGSEKIRRVAPVLFSHGRLRCAIGTRTGLAACCGNDSPTR